MTGEPQPIQGVPRAPRVIALHTGLRKRILKMLLAVLIAWLVGFMASLPTQVLELVRVADGDRRLLFYSLGDGLMVWALVTGIIAACQLVIFLGPVATIVSPAWLLRHRVLSILLLPSLSLTAVIYKLSVFYVLEPGHILLKSMFQSYGVFILVFSLTSGILYIRQLGRGR